MEGDDNQKRWELYYQKTVDRPPHITLLKAIDLVQITEKKSAIDLGCGSGRSTLWLLAKGYSVLATDKDQIPFSFFFDKLKEETRINFDSLIARFEELTLTAYPQADLIYAGYSIPFCAPEHFEALWRKIVVQLKSGGVFSGQFFGHKHSWLSTEKNMTFHTERAVRNLLDSFTIEYFEEEEADDLDVENKPVHWHVFHVIVRKR